MSGKGPILIVDDDRDDHETMEQAASDLGIKNKLLFFLNGKEVLSYLSLTTDQPFLIMCDMNMPEVNGIELRNRINEMESLWVKAIPFVFFTTSASPQSVRQAYEKGLQGFFEKPSNYEDLKRLFKKVYDYWNDCRHPTI